MKSRVKLLALFTLFLKALLFFAANLMLMWNSLARVILRYGYLWLAILLAVTVFLGWQASKVKLSYEFSRAIPTDNPKYEEYQEFRKKFGDDGNLLVVGIGTKDF